MFKPYQYSNKIILFVFSICISLISIAQPAIPHFQTFQPVNTNQSVTPLPAQAFTFQRNPILGNSSPEIENQNMLIIQRAGMTIPGFAGENLRQQQLNSLRQELKQEEKKEQESQYINSMHNFQNYFNQLLQLHPDSFSITKAVYLSEAAFYDKPYSFNEFEAAFKQGAELVKQMLKRENLSTKNNTALNYGIQKLYTGSNLYYNNKTGKSYVIDKLHYDFDDYLGEKDWKKMFVTKMLQTGSGQCHSMPLFYLCVAEQLNAKAYLSLAPNHSFIQFLDSKGKVYNFETTNGNLVSIQWLMQSASVNATAFKNKTYLDTLSNRKLYAQCLADLAANYSEKINGYDNLLETMIEKVLDIDSSNVAALMIRANQNYAKMTALAKQAGYPPVEKMQAYPLLYAAYQQQKQADTRVRQTGYQEMPKEMYEQWLKSFEQAKKQEQQRQEQEKLKREIESLKKMKSSFKNIPIH